MKTLRHIIAAALLVCAPFAFGQVPLLVSSVRGAVGSAAAPTYTFVGNTGDGIYQSGAGSVSFAALGAATIRITTGGQIVGTLGGGILRLGTSGQITATASGANQSITLTPSGTGFVKFQGVGQAGNIGDVPTSTAYGGLYLGGVTPNLFNFVIASDGTETVVNAPATGSIRFALANGSAKMTLAHTSGNLLVGGLTTDGTGVLQFPAATTTAGGITFGTDIFVYRSSANNLNIDGGGALTNLRVVGPSAVIALVQATNATTVTFGSATAGASTLLASGAGLTAVTLDSSQNATFAKLITSYNGIATAGNGVASVQGAGTVTAQTGAASSIATYTVGASDADFIVSGQVTVTASTTNSFSLECAYTDAATNTARVVTFNVQQLTGTLITSITNVTGVGPYEGVPLHLRAKASTAITIRTNSGGTYTSVTYSASGVIQKLQ